ncbi:helix-turn-helix domain-containing protein [Microbacterium insulae]|uniref:Helix-turn-helix domain-containing protein n=1 Tax=Microbacterium insulae TaxID=483014 RepID=A0ABW3AFM6_9MICO
MDRGDGFEGQRVAVVPRSVVESALGAPVTRRMMVTDAGWFPLADRHARRRASGARETIVIVCVAGSGWIETGGVAERLAAGDAAIIPHDVPHAYGAAPGDPWTIWWLHVVGTDVAELVSAAGVFPGRAKVTLRSPDPIVALLDEILLALSRDTTSTTLIAASGIAWRVMTELATDRRRPERGTPLQRAIRVLEERIDRRVSVPELSALVGLSPSHLSALFREATGGGVIAYHSILKMARARTLLDTTDLSIADVGRAVGMHDPFYFSRRFSRLHGVSPRSYRAMAKF